MALSVIRILSITILIQVSVAPAASSDDTIGGILKTEVQNLLKKGDNLQKVIEVFQATKKEAVDATKEARNKIASYGKNKLPGDMKKLLEYIANAPQEAFDEMKPMLEEIQKLNKELEEESLAYRVIARPVLGFVSGLRYFSMRAFGFACQSLPDLMQLFTASAQKGVDAYYEGKPAEESKKVNEMLETMNAGLNKVKRYGNKVDERGRKGLEKNLQRKNSAKKGADDANAQAKAAPMPNPEHTQPEAPISAKEPGDGQTEGVPHSEDTRPKESVVSPPSTDA